MFCNEVMNEDRTMFKPVEEIVEKFKEHNIDLTKIITFSCRSGITSCISELAARLAGATRTANFDGSYQEYSTKGIPDLSDPEWESKYEF